MEFVVSSRFRVERSEFVAVATRLGTVSITLRTARKNPQKRDSGPNIARPDSIAS